MINAWHLVWIIPSAALIGLIAEGLLQEAKNNSD